MTPSRAAPPEAEPELARETLEKCKAHDPKAFRAFVLRYQGPVFAVLSRMVGPGPQVQDLAQEVFLRAYRALSSFDVDGPARVSTWLLTIAVRLALNSKKKMARSIVVPLADAAAVRDVKTPETEQARLELGRAIARAAAELSDDQTGGVHPRGVSRDVAGRYRDCSRNTGGHCQDAVV